MEVSRIRKNLSPQDWIRSDLAHERGASGSHMVGLPCRR
jgi:hypothetical protein